jgi:ABC-2 type transport system permease protein
MLALFKKEINGFFSSISGYIVIVVFLIANGLFLWIFPGDLNVFDSGYASLDTMFLISPWVFLFLVPAITMRLFSDEKRTGTIELLLTRPLTDLQIVLSKYFAGVVLVIFSLLPTLVYFVSVYMLGNPVGDIDTGGTWGSFFGLFCLASVYAAIGIFASSISDNQIVAFIVAMLFSFFLYIGFESISSLAIFGNHESFIINLGINEHYKSMSRGVIDTRDVVYFIMVISIFIMLTKVKLQSRKW